MSASTPTTAPDGGLASWFAPLRSARLVLRPFRLSDVEQLSQMAGVAEIAQQTLNIRFPFGPDLAAEWIKSTHQDLAADLGLTLALMLPPDRRGGDSLVGAIVGDIVGAVGLTRDQDNPASAELGYWIARLFWGRGYATEAVTRLLDHGKKVMSLTSVWACTFAENQGSQRVLEKLGMTATARRRENCPQRGGMRDIAYHEMKLDCLSHGRG